MSEPASATASCPICGRDTVPELRPFCSRRCADVDLGRWFSGQYRTPSLRTGSELDDEEQVPGPLDRGSGLG